MKALKNIDIAFLPMNLPYTMTPEMVANGAARRSSPRMSSGIRAIRVRPTFQS
jgi:hypothetical protein